tara:strand:- start:768 stop:944 length:177 start_codon:yes stop_codon:yes gene_type:complete
VPTKSFPCGDGKEKTGIMYGTTKAKRNQNEKKTLTIESIWSFCFMWQKYIAGRKYIKI